MSEVRACILAALATCLTLWSLTPLIEGTQWYTPAALLVSLTAVVSITCRVLKVPHSAILPIQAFFGLLGLTALSANSAAVAKIIPTPASMEVLRGLIQQGGEEITRFGPPLRSDPGVNLLIFCGALALALLVDICVVSLQSPAGAGLPLLAAFCLPAAILPGGNEGKYFAAAVGGWLILLLNGTRETIFNWGQLLPSARWAKFPIHYGQFLALGLVALLLAGISISNFQPSGIIDTRFVKGGLKNPSVNVINPLVELRKNLTQNSDTEVLRYQSNQSTPPLLKLSTSEIFDGETWQPNTGSINRKNIPGTSLPPPPGLTSVVSRSAAQVRVEIGSNLGQKFLPVPYPATKINITGSWFYDPATLNVATARGSIQNRNYSVEYFVPTPTLAQLRSERTTNSAEFPEELSIPPGTDPLIANQALQLTKKLQYPYEKALALQNWFRESGDFDYSLDAPEASGSDAIRDFLNERKGYCIHFASAMALMARTIGIPARITVGFLPGVKVGSWQSVRVSDAHAWPELYLPDLGWTRFEPTPASRTGSLQNTTQPSTPSPTTSPTPSPSVSSSPPSPTRQSLTGTTPSQSKTSPIAASEQSNWLVWVLGLGLVVLGLCSGQLVVWLRRRRRRTLSSDAQIRQLWSDLNLGMQDLGAPLGARQTPRQNAQLMIDHFKLGPQDQARLAKLLVLVEAERFGRSGQRAAGAQVDDPQLLLKAARGHCSRKLRVKAWLWPRAGWPTLLDTLRH